MKRDDMSNISPVVVFGPITINADNTPAAIDLGDADSATIQIAVGVGGITFTADNKIEFKVTASDTSDGTYAAVAAADVVLGTGCDTSVGTGGIVKSLIAAHAAASISQFAYVGGKRFIKVLADFSGTHGAGTPLAVSVQKSRLYLGGQS